MSLARKARLARVTARLNPPVWPDPQQHRRELLHHVEFGLVLRETLPRLGVDPSQVTMLSVCDEAAEELRTLGHDVPDRPDPNCWELAYLAFVSTPPPDVPDDEPPAPPLPDDDPRVKLLNKLDRMIGPYLDDREIDFGKVSLMQVFYWCAARLAERWWVPDEADEEAETEEDLAAD
jgi:hypothetical protein